MILFLFAAADATSPAHEVHTITSMQHTSMENALQTPKNQKRSIFMYLYWGLATVFEASEDCCLWRGVDCDDGVVKGLTLTGKIQPSWPDRKYSHMDYMFWGYDEHGKSWEIDPSWLPMTIESMYLDHVIFPSALNLRTLPHELRYFYLVNGKMRTAPPRDMLSLKNLPKNIEEFIVRSCTSLCGTISMSSAPSSLKVCNIANADIHRVLYDSESMQRLSGIEKFAITGKRTEWENIEDGSTFLTARAELQYCSTERMNDLYCGSRAIVCEVERHTWED